MDEKNLREDEPPRPLEEHALNEENITKEVIEEPVVDKDLEELGWPIALRNGVWR